MRGLNPAPMPDAPTLDLGVVGNGRTAALLDTKGRLVWWCYPRFDGDPVFSRLLAGDEEKGFTDVVLDGLTEIETAYVRNTATIETIMRSRDGSSIRITDFAPRYKNLGRIYRPPQLIRIIEPLSGYPRISIRFRPTHNHGEEMRHCESGSNHIRYHSGHFFNAIRLTTDAPLSYVEKETPFVLTHPVHLVFGADESFPDDLRTACRELNERTIAYWHEWVQYLSIGYDWQDEVIRAAITLKLCNFEETGAIVAALTTSIPESPHSGRNWDYRACWLRDAFFVVQALNHLGATRTMEEFIGFVLSIAAGDVTELRPVYGIVPSDALTERVAENLKGYDGHGLVRIGNAAADQVQHDAYGSVILAAVPMFFDRRLPHPASPALFPLLERLGAKCAELALMPDAGIWEYRGRARVHTYSAAMCWAGVNRVAAIARHLKLDARAAHWSEISDRLERDILAAAWNPKLNAFTAAFESDDLDASALLLADLGLVEASDPRFTGTVDAIERHLMRGNHVMRYAAADDFGEPETAFLVCRFWLADARWRQGRKEEARDLFRDALRYRNHFGLLSEDVHPATGALWGNFPQTYSLAGLILTAKRLSRSWEDRYWHGSS